MKNLKERKTKPVASLSIDLLNEGKSRRLLEMRRKAFGLPENQTDEIGKMTDSGQDKTTEADLAIFQGIIDERVNLILSRFPSDKKKRFFKIRYGMTPKQLKELPIGDILEILGVKQMDADGMKRMANLDYNGRPISKRR
ncbi:hypothetical protein [Methylomarinum vadi]|uniref:hypothetical protein n=1 Tax=Methylomarinum vadi TaxID=438855 RepID=UPI0004DEFF80|nr:hypothetical protein [Methylomarinum vadi]